MSRIVSENFRGLRASSYSGVRPLKSPAYQLWVNGLSDDKQIIMIARDARLRRTMLLLLFALVSVSVGYWTAPRMRIYFTQQ